MRIETINTNHGKVEFSISGIGKPILFLHGGHSNCRETLFHKGFDIKKYSLITPSRPGYGNTPLGKNISPKTTAELMISLLDSLNIEKVIIYAISAGGLTAIELAGGYPARVEKLILASAVSKDWLDKKGGIYKTAKILFNPRTEKIVWGTIKLFSGIFPKTIAKSFYPQFTTNKLHKLAKRDIIELLTTFKHFNSKSGFISDIDHHINDNILSEINCPTLIIHSKNDNSVSFIHAEHAKKWISNSILIGLNNEWGHLLWIGMDSDESIKQIMEFIEEKPVGLAFSES